MLFIVVVVFLESRNRTQRYQIVGKYSSRQSNLITHTKTKTLAFLFCSSLFIFAFVLPVGQLLVWFFANKELFIQTRYIEFFTNSLSLSLIGATVLTLLAIIVIAAQRFLQRHYRYQQATIRFVGRLMTMGYAIPGTVLAVGLFVPLAFISKFLIQTTGWQSQLLTGSLFALLLGYLIRFFAVAYRPIDSQLEAFSANLEEMSESFRVTGWQKWRQVVLPLIKPGLLTAFALSFVDIMKEMPLTLMTRPFGWDTLAVQIFELTSEGEWEKASVPSIAIVLAGLIPVYFLNKQRRK